MSGAHHRFPQRSGPKSGDVFASLDIGCSKITCLIARRDIDDPKKFTLLGGGRQQSRGFEAGAITDMEQLERAIRLAVEDAERQAGERIDDVVLGVTGPRLKCQLLSAKISTNGKPVSARDIKRVQAAALSRAEAKLDGHIVLTAHPVAYRIDGQDGVKDPTGMHGQTLGVLVSVVSVPETQLLNLLECVGRAHLSVSRLVPAAIATGMGALIEDEIENGAICFDFGAGVTTSAVFLNGVPAWLGLVPAGGAHVTSDIAQGLGTTFAAAERLKTVNGMTDPKGVGHADMIDCPLLGDDGRLQAKRMPKGQLAEIIAPRVEEILEIAQRKLSGCVLKKVMPRRGVLTGGASLIPGMRETATEILSMPVRLGRPVSIDRLGETYASPAFSTAAGLLSYALAGLPDATDTARRGISASENRTVHTVNRVFSWVKENF